MKIRPRKLPSGKRSYQLDLGMVSGRRVQLNFKTRQEAEAEMAARKAEVKQHGEMAFELTHQDRLRLLVARDQLASVGATIEEAVEFFLKHARPAKEPVPMGALLDLCLEAKMEEHLRPGSLRQLKSVGLSLVRHVGETQLCHELSKREIEEWLRANQWAPKTWNNYLGDIRTIFSWAKAQGYVAMNPCDGIARKRMENDEIAFVSAADVARIFRRAEEIHADDSGRRRTDSGFYEKTPLEEEDFRDFLPWLTIGFFCGLRPERELGELETARVQIDQALVVVTARTVKTRARRTVDLSPNAVAWLRAYPPTGEMVRPKAWVRRWRRLRQAVGLLETWPHDGMRHTFATYHYAHHANETKLQALMGHDDGTVLHQHYRGLATPKEAERFWALMPQS